MSVTIVTRPGAGYPQVGSAFSPSQRYPEYAFSHVADVPNPVYAAVRSLLADHGLDKERHGTPEWNPLGELVPAGSRVFVLCNFVFHRRPHESTASFQAKCVHGSVLRALIDYLLLAVGEEGSVRFGNSALQSCDFRKVLADTGADRVEAFYRDQGRSVRARDLRLYVAPRDSLGRVTSVDRGDDREGVEIDLGSRSLLPETHAPGGRSPAYRISDYDPRRLLGFHAGGQHRYVIHRDFLESDVVIHLSKLKTHEKVGITCGLKGFVGAVGHKDCLAHHRFGNPAIGGDEYPDSLAFLRSLSRFHDWVNRRGGDAALQTLAQIGDRNLRRILRRCGAIGSGAWYGNDTAWRMTLDLVRIGYYANAAGQMHSRPQRRHLSLIDGLVAGEGDGPLNPDPVRAGVLLFGDDVALTDRVASRVMGFDPDRIPLIREAFRPEPWPLTRREPGAYSECVVDGRPLLETEIEAVLARPFRPTRGWSQWLQPGR